MFASLIKRIWGGRSRQETAWKVYGRAVVWARQPVFYARFGVADSLDGRFDMILLNLYLILRRLRADDTDTEFQQLIQEALVADMDRTLREMGVGDMGVGKQVKRMAAAWMGRTQALDAALSGWPEADCTPAVLDVIARNVFRLDEGGADDCNVQALTAWFFAGLTAIMDAGATEIAGLPDDWPSGLISTGTAEGTE